MSLTEDQVKKIKEMLTLVANAMGLECDSVMLGSTLSAGVILKDQAGYWNPLTDDAASRRMQVKLGIDLFVRNEHAEAIGPMTPVFKVRYEDVGESELGTTKEIAARMVVFEAAACLARKLAAQNQ